MTKIDIFVQFMENFFEDVYEGRAVEMEDIGVKLKRILIDVESSVASGYSSREMRASTTISKLFRYVSIVAISLAICYYSCSCIDVYV